MLILMSEKSAAVPDQIRLEVCCFLCNKEQSEVLKNYFLSSNSQADTALDWAGLEEEA